MSIPKLSTTKDFDQWIQLAKEVKPLFGPMTDDPHFHSGLKQALSNRSAICIPVIKEETASILPGGIIISRKTNEILWFAVSKECRGKGFGKALLEEAIKHLDTNKPITVVTFDNTVPVGTAARKLYQGFGFVDSTPGPVNPAGIATITMIRKDRC